MDTQASLYRLPRFIAGLDVGQTADPSALAILEWTMLLWQGQLEPRWDVRHLERIPLQTSYPSMATGVRERLEKLRAPCFLVMDATGVGLPVVEDFRDAWMEVDRVTGARLPVPGKPPIVGIILTGGEAVRDEGWQSWYVPKRDVVMQLIRVLQQQRFRVAAALPDAQTLFKEGQNFQWKVSKAGNDLYGAWREGQHDDLLLAVAIAVWWGERYAPRTVPEQHQQYATAARNPLLRASGGRR